MKISEFVKYEYPPWDGLMVISKQILNWQFVTLHILLHVN